MEYKDRHSSTEVVGADDIIAISKKFMRHSRVLTIDAVFTGLCCCIAWSVHVMTNDNKLRYFWFGFFSGASGEQVAGLQITDDSSSVDACSGQTFIPFLSAMYISYLTV